MSDTKKLIEELDKKVGNLIAKVQDLSAAVDSKSKEVSELTSELENQKKNSAAMEAEYASLKNQPSAEGSTNNDEMKGRISDLVKEIDECISMLKV